jgi:predicted dehydrogenase
MKKLKVAIVGVGNIANKAYLPAIAKSQNLSLVAVSEILDDRREKVGKELEVNTYKSFNEMIAEESIDFIIALTPHKTHRPIIEASAKKGIHVFKEKPFAVDLKEAAYLAKLAEDSNIQIATSVQRRFSEVHKKFNELIYKVGTPYFIEGKYCTLIDKPYASSWRGYKMMAGGGCIIDMGYHLVDLIVWYFGLPDNVIASFSKIASNVDYDVEDTANIMFGYESGLHGSAILSSYYLPKTEYLKVFGNEGVLTVEKDAVYLFDKRGTVVEELRGTYDMVDLMNRQLDDFCKKLYGGTDAHTKNDTTGSLDDMAMIEACYSSNDKRVNPKSLLADAIKI